MGDRTVLGAADVSDVELTGLVARQLGVPADAIRGLTSVAEVAPYDLEALTTAGRFWVQGTASVGDVVRPYRFFVKHVQSFARSPIFALVPPATQERADALLPWQTEPKVYRSDLADRLPAGLAMPAAYGVYDLDEESAAVWLEAVPAVETDWVVERFAHAAYLLGRLAGSPSVRPLAGLGHGSQERTIRGYVEGRIVPAVLPALRDPGLWRHPLVAGPFDESLRARLLSAADDVWPYVDELARMPNTASHGDACPRNLLVRNDSADLTLIDFGFWGEAPIGFDLGQLVLAEVQMGERSAGGLLELEATCLESYLEGMAAEGVRPDARQVQRSHALLMLLFAGLTAIPFEHLEREPTPELHRIASERAASARFILDLVDATG